LAARNPVSSRNRASASADALRVQRTGIVDDPLSEELKKLATLLDGIAKNREADEEQIELTSAAERCRGLAIALKAWLGQELGGQVYWIELSGERARRIELASAPIEVGPALEEHLYSKVPTVVMTSATLSVGGRGGFGHFQRRLGLTDCETLQLGSPFNYRQ